MKLWLMRVESRVEVCFRIDLFVDGTLFFHMTAFLKFDISPLQGFWGSVIA